MPQQVQKEQTGQSRSTSETAPVKGLSEERQAEVDAAKADTDDLLDDIDALLESVGEDLAVEYRQEGGQ
jgi:uncharacterized FlaG/YvyC family protein